MIRWKFDGVEIDRNPDVFRQRPKKKVTYNKIITGESIRITPPRDKVAMYLEVGWTSLTETWRNKFHDWYMNDKKFTLQSHLTSNPRDVWTVKIDEFNAPYKMGYGNQRWDVNMVLRVIDTVNDPILRNSYASTPHLFVVQNDANVTVHDAYVIVRPKAKEFTYNFVGKVSADLTVPHVAYKGSYPSLLAPNDNYWEELTQEEYDAIEQDGTSTFFSDAETKAIYGDSLAGEAVAGASSDHYQQLQFSFNVTNIAGGNIDDIRDGAHNLRFYFDGYGYGDNNGSQEYGVEIHAYDSVNATWELLHTDTSTTFAQLETNVSMFSQDLANYIDDNGIIRFAAKTVHPAGATFDSTIYVDHVSFAMDAMFAKTPSVTQTYLNLLRNPGFESNLDNWVDGSSVWSIDYVYYFEGDKAAKTYTLNAPLYQDAYCPEGEDLTVMWTVRGDKDGTNNVRLTLEYLDSSNSVLGSYSSTQSASTDFQTFWFTTPSQTPANTVKVRFKLEKIAGTATTDDYIYVDRLLLRLGSSSNEPVWTNHAHRVLTYNDIVKNNEILRFNLGTKNADINGLSNVIDKVSGDWFTIPSGRSLIVFGEHANSNQYAEAVVRYEEVSV